MSTTTPPRTHCPTCGAKLARQDMSNCPYCSTPFELVERGAAPSGPSPNLERLERMPEKDEYHEGLEWEPPESEAWFREQRRGRRGFILAVIGALVAMRGLTGPGPALASWATWTGLAVVIAGFVLHRISLQRRRELTRLPLLRRPAIILDRRSTTEIQGAKGETIYYFTLELGDGSVGEFRFPGRGPSYDLFTVGNTGLAYTRGQELLAFKRIRV